MLRIHVSVQWHDEIDDASVYEMKCTFVGAKLLGCYNPPPLEKISSRDLESVPISTESRIIFL